MQPLNQQLSNEQAILDAMATAEALAPTDWHSACCQMFALYPAASARFMHDVCDSIDLWISSEWGRRAVVKDLDGHVIELLTPKSA